MKSSAERGILDVKFVPLVRSCWQCIGAIRGLVNWTDYGALKPMILLVGTGRNKISFQIIQFIIAEN